MLATSKKKPRKELTNCIYTLIRYYLYAWMPGQDFLESWIMAQWIFYGMILTTKSANQVKNIHKAPDCSGAIIFR